jgi:predicted small metal-binding protein
MKSKTIIEFPIDEVLKILQEHYNKIHGQDHSFSLIGESLPNKLTLELSKWDKNEKAQH